jgi:hypothetical protein
MDEYFEVKVHGEYFAQSGKDRVIRGYKAVFRLPNADAPLGIIKGKLLTPFLMKKDPAFTDVYTHHIDEINPKGRKFDPDEIPYRFQTKEQLKEYCRRHRLPIKVEDYGSLGLLRDHVRIAKEEPENFPAIYERFSKKREEEKELYALNEEVFNEGEVGIPVPLKEGGDANNPAPQNIEDILQ